jgi:hypothetical protein
MWLTQASGGGLLHLYLGIAVLVLAAIRAGPGRCGGGTGLCPAEFNTARTSVATATVTRQPIKVYHGQATTARHCTYTVTIPASARHAGALVSIFALNRCFSSLRSLTMALTSSLSNASAFSSLSKMPTKSKTNPCGFTISAASFS